MNNKYVKFDLEGTIGIITLNRPEKRNALSLELLEELNALLTATSANKDVRVVILRGEGKVFCAGHDISQLVDREMPYYKTIFDSCVEVMEKNQRLPQPVIAQVHGYCVAAGCYLQMCCDIGIAAENAVLGHPATRGGGVSSMPLWITMLGLRKAKELIYTGKLISGTEAERIGLVNMAIPEDKLEEEVWKMATNIAEVPLDGMAIAKEALNTHAEILNRTAVFTYHRQLNALGRVGRRRDEGGGLNLDALRQRTRGQ